MNYEDVRVKNNFSQLEMAILLGVPVQDLRDWESAKKEPDESVKALYQQAENTLLAFSLFSAACDRKYASIQEIKLVLSLIPRFTPDKLNRAILQMNLIKSNSHFNPKDLGMKVTRVYVSKKRKKSK